jgi:hypothetical protein
MECYFQVPPTHLGCAVCGIFIIRFATHTRARAHARTRNGLQHMCSNTLFNTGDTFTVIGKAI